MTQRDNPVTVYLTDKEKAKLKEWSNETGKSISELSRDAILEYTDFDRFQRIEEKVDSVLTLLENGEHTHTKDRASLSKSMSVPEKARTIAQRCYKNHDMPMKNKDVEIAIEDIAGGDDRTVDKHKSQLKKRGLLYEHPMGTVWTDDKEMWVSWVENATVGEDVHDYTDEYSMDIDEYDKIAEKVTQ